MKKLIIAQKRADEPVLERVQTTYESNAKGSYKRSILVHHTPKKLKLIIQNDMTIKDNHSDDDHKSYEEAMQSLDHDKWREVIEYQINGIDEDQQSLDFG